MESKEMKGKRGELLAAEYLLSKGYEIKAQNYRYKKSEIDLIAAKETLLVFVEVKYRTSAKFGFPEHFVSEQQVEKIVEAGVHYMETIQWDGRVRYDIIAILQVGHTPEIAHFEDAFF